KDPFMIIKPSRRKIVGQREGCISNCAFDAILSVLPDQARVCRIDCFAAGLHSYWHECQNRQKCEGDNSERKRHFDQRKRSFPFWLTHGRKTFTRPTNVSIVVANQFGWLACVITTALPFQKPSVRSK